MPPFSEVLSKLNPAGYLYFGHLRMFWAEQTAIAAVRSDIDAEIANLETQLTKTRAIKQGVMQQLLTGEIRLI